MVKLAIDFEHASRTWWESGGQELWDGIRESEDESSVVIDDDLAESWLAQARAIPGWADGHEYAPHPISARPFEDDEDL